MKKHHIGPPTDCTTHSCDWAYILSDDENSASYLACIPGGGDCMPFNLLFAEEIDGSRTDPLSDAVRQMKLIASNLTPPDDTYTLSLFHVPYGVVPEALGATVMLGWVRHDVALPSGGKYNVVTAKSPPEDIARALGLKKRESKEK
jgi:hypothetical protein